MALCWKIWVDTGGTFTDCIAFTPQGNPKRLKVLSHGALKGQVVKQLTASSLEVLIAWPVTTDIFQDFTFSTADGKRRGVISKVDITTSVVHLKSPLKSDLKKGDSFEIRTGEEVPVFAARLLTETPLADSFPAIEMKLGSTRGTNALLEKKGARTAFIVTKGFRDLLVIGNQQRKDLFALHVHKEKALYEGVIEVDERIEADGTVLRSLDRKELQRIASEIKKRTYESIAIAFVNSYKNPAHENLLADYLSTEGFQFVSVSSHLSGQIKILQRAETAVANAYLDPIIHTYVSRIRTGLQQADLKIMNSSGGLMDSNSFAPKDSLLSGPAGGVAGAARCGITSNMKKLITFDMGGTSTDVSLYDDGFSYRYESKVGEIKILSPSLSIETIAAGGGSICDFDGHRLLVGPHSAGAYPGPACYGSGGPLTITDVNLLLGRTDQEFFSIPLHRAKSEEALQQLLKKIKKSSGRGAKSTEVLQSLVQIANEKMAEAIKKVSVQHGHDPADYTLLSFGGAGGQHACALADILQMKHLLVPYDAGLLSAYGIGHARVERFEEKLLLQPLYKTIDQLDDLFRSLADKGASRFIKEGFDSKDVAESRRLIFLRFKGQESTLELSFTNAYELTEQFEQKYRALYGHWLEDREIEAESIRLVLTAGKASPVESSQEEKKYTPVPIKVSHKKHAVFLWEELRAGASIKGPAIVVSKNSTTVVDGGWNFYLNKNNHAVLQRAERAMKTKSYSKEAALELFSNRFTAVAQEMGALLQRTSFSVNVKERLDFSCALLDAQGYLVVNAPHIPVHLGSMGVCVREVMKVLTIDEGDVIITNHPAFGGSHLPDVTLIKPIFYQKKLIGFAATRAHHAEIGGKKPGSMPADATTLEEEGVIIAPDFLIKKGVARWKEIEKIFTAARYPTRLLHENLADLNGALASVNLGEQSLQALCEKYGVKQVKEFMHALKFYASSLLINKINESKSRIVKARELLDDGAVLQVRIELKNKKIRFDFSGSAKIHAGNLNATKAIVQSVVLYVLRLWVDKPIAMNEGLMEPVTLVLPTGLLNPDFTKTPLPAVVGGNTEISQRLTDLLLKALGLAACSQGTMNNFLFGNERFGFYETICGGTGAGQGFDGASAVHSHMTNTRITDPEVLELRYPVRLEKFEVRKGSGGNGKWKGGDGVVREITFNENAEVNILSQHRTVFPYGLKGGEEGKTGSQKKITKKGSVVKLKGMDSVSVAPGDCIQINTPGGGGYGKRR